ncbi:winged helix-turn-helix transcriptional regulator [Arthrobacter sp. NPDC097144]|uniref:winged helix-turn-helix transcriptional regulator n=1 Tax=Arthrobacter sp. NPDC097144 TaxID=3363946 RepID=UPI00380FB25A
MLTVWLRDLEAAGLVECLVQPTIPVSIRCRLSAGGIDLRRALQPITHYARWESGDGGGPAAATGS